MEIENNTTGIELTKLYITLGENGNSAKLERLLQEKIEQAIRLFEEKSGPALVFAIGFNGNTGIINRKLFIEQQLIIYWLIVLTDRIVT